MTGTQTAPTWGIDGMQFLYGYAIAFTLVALAIGWQWLNLIGRPVHDDGDLSEQDLYDLAMLAEGPQLAITSAAAQLYEDGLLRAGPGVGTLAVYGELSPDADPLEREIFETVKAQPGITSAELRAQIADGDELRAMTAELESGGLLLPVQPRVALVRRMALAGGLLALVGIARIVAGLIGGHPVGFIALATVAVVAVTIGAMAKSPQATARGRERLHRWRAQHDVLREEPQSGQGALAVALFGGAALWLAAPELAVAMDIEREQAASGGGGGGGGCGGGGCGGGGCGGGCGG